MTLRNSNEIKSFSCDVTPFRSTLLCGIHYLPINTLAKSNPRTPLLPRITQYNRDRTQCPFILYFIIISHCVSIWIQINIYISAYLSFKWKPKGWKGKKAFLRWIWDIYSKREKKRILFAGGFFFFFPRQGFFFFFFLLSLSVWLVCYGYMKKLMIVVSCFFAERIRQI